MTALGYLAAIVAAGLLIGIVVRLTRRDPDPWSGAPRSDPWASRDTDRDRMDRTR